MKRSVVSAALALMIGLASPHATAVNAHLLGGGEAVGGGCAFTAAFSGSHVSGPIWSFEGTYESPDPGCGGSVAFVCVDEWDSDVGGTLEACVGPVPPGDFFLAAVVLGLNADVPFTLPNAASGTATVVLI